jgi:hypothetical protein
MTKAEAVELARNVIRRLGYSAEQLYVDLEPEVYLPKAVWTNTIPHYRITWLTPNATAEIPSVQIEINAAARKFERIWLPSVSLYRDPPLLPGVIVTNTSATHDLPSDEAHRLMLRSLPRISRFAQALGLPIPNPFTADEVADFSFYEEHTTRLGTIKTRDGFTFNVVENQVRGFDAPDRFFGWDHHVNVKQLASKWNITETEAIELARRTLTKAGASKALLAGSPSDITKPFGAARHLVPRCVISWDLDMGQAAFAEVDGASGTVKSLMLHIFTPHSSEM